jgi:hypothetical protein
MKRIFIKVASSERDPIVRNIEPDTTAGDILSGLNLEGYVLIPPAGSNRFPSYDHPFFNSEVLYPIVRDGLILLAQTSADFEEIRLQSLLHGLELVDKYPHVFSRLSEK